MGKLKIVINGAGAAGISIARLLLRMGFGEIVMCDKDGALYDGAPGMTVPQAEMAKVTNHDRKVRLQRCLWARMRSSGFPVRGW